MMTQLLLTLTIVCLAGLAAAEQAYPSHFYPIEHRSELAALTEAFPVNTYEYTVIPNDLHAVTEYDTEISLMDYIPNPITAIKTIASKALSVVKCLLPKLSLVILGVALVIGFCAFTPYCTLILEKPFTRELRSFTNSYPLLDDVQNFVSEAYTKYRDMQTL